MEKQELFYQELYNYMTENRGETPGSAFVNNEYFRELKQEIFNEIGYFGHITSKFPNNTISLRGITIIPFFEESDEIYFSKKPFKFK